MPILKNHLGHLAQSSCTRLSEYVCLDPMQATLQLLSYKAAIALQQP